MPRILLIDDDIELSRLLGSYLKGEGFEMSTANDGVSGVSSALSGAFDAVLLDVMLPRLNGIDALRLIRHQSDVPVIMLTARGDGMDRLSGLDAGADDYITKPYFSPELVARLRAVMRRRTTRGGTEPALVLGMLRLWPARRRVTYADTELALTASEFNVLELLLRQAEGVVCKDEMSLQALGRRRTPYDRSLDVHISNLRQKLSTHHATDIAIETVRGIGYRLVAA